jgi:hypothetical protein
LAAPRWQASQLAADLTRGSLPGFGRHFAVLADEARGLGDARRLAGTAQLAGVAGVAFEESSDFLPIFGVDRSIVPKVIFQAG